MQTTYTMLVTIAHDGPAPDPAALAAHVQQGLEEGTREHRGHYSATCDAVQGDYFGVVRVGRVQEETARAMHAARDMHATLRA